MLFLARDADLSRAVRLKQQQKQLEMPKNARVPRGAKQGAPSPDSAASPLPWAVNDRNLRLHINNMEPDL
jgi:hypothetical protein